MGVVLVDVMEDVCVVDGDDVILEALSDEAAGVVMG